MRSSDILVDDHLLLLILLGSEPSGLRPHPGRLFTTGLWYHRLGRALSDRTVTGAMSRLLGSAAPAVGAKAVRAAADLPRSIGLVSLRSLGWPMARLVADGARLNLLSLEALAAAEHLEADICLATADENRPLVTAAQERQVGIRMVET